MMIFSVPFSSFIIWSWAENNVLQICSNCNVAWKQWQNIFSFAAMTKYFVSCFVWKNLISCSHFLSHPCYRCYCCWKTALNQFSYSKNVLCPSVDCQGDFFPSFLASFSLPLFFFLPWEIFLKCKGAKNLLKSQERRILRNFKHVISGCSLLLR